MDPLGERRKFVRLNFSVEVVYRKHAFKAEDGGSVSKNISSGGICLIVYEELKASQLLDLEFYLPEDKIPVKALGKVVWTSDFQMGDHAQNTTMDVGIEFIKIEKSGLDRINKYVFEHLSAD